MITFLKPLHIMVEGPDGIGKTTSATKISTKLHIPLLKMVKAKKAFNNNTIEDLSYVFNHTLLQLKDISYVVDRGPISSIIYSNVFKRSNDLKYLYSICEKINPLIFYLTSSNKNQMFAQKKHDRIITIAERVAIHNEYAKFFDSKCPFNYTKINIINKSRQEVVQAILDYLVANKYIDIK